MVGTHSQSTCVHPRPLPLPAWPLPSHCPCPAYIVVTDEATGRTIPNAFLDRVKEEFVGKYADKGRNVPELGLSNFG